MIRVYTGDKIPKNAIKFEDIDPKRIVEMAHTIVLHCRNLVINHNTKDIVIVTYNSVLVNALDAWSEFYEVQDSVAFYLDEKFIEHSGNNPEIYLIYQYLYGGYDIIDKIEAATMLGKN